ESPGNGHEFHSSSGQVLSSPYRGQRSTASILKYRHNHMSGTKIQMCSENKVDLHTHKHTHTRAHTRAHPHTRTHAHTHTRTHTHTQTHTRTHTDTLDQARRIKHT